MARENESTIEDAAGLTEPGSPVKSPAEVAGTFPPKSWLDIAAYDTDETVAGYREYRPDDPAPGENRSPGYRWGWANRRKDSTGVPDGFEAVRREYIRETGMLQTRH